MFDTQSDYWLNQDREERDQLSDFVQELKDSGHVFMTHDQYDQWCHLDNHYLPNWIEGLDDFIRSEFGEPPTPHSCIYHPFNGLNYPEVLLEWGKWCSLG